MRLPTLHTSLPLLLLFRDTFLNFFYPHRPDTPPGSRALAQKIRAHVVPAPVGVEEGKEDDGGESGCHFGGDSCRYGCGEFEWWRWWGCSRRRRREEGEEEEVRIDRGVQCWYIVYAVTPQLQSVEYRERSSS
jgi:hypothetical protein